MKLANEKFTTHATQLKISKKDLLENSSNYVQRRRGRSCASIQSRTFQVITKNFFQFSDGSINRCSFVIISNRLYFASSFVLKKIIFLSRCFSLQRKISLSVLVIAQRSLFTFSCFSKAGAKHG